MRERNHLATHRLAQGASPRDDAARVRVPAVPPRPATGTDLAWTEARQAAPSLDGHLLRRHYCRFRALCRQTTGRWDAALPKEWLWAAVGALAFEDESLQRAVAAHCVDGTTGGGREVISWKSYVYLTGALDDVSDKLAFCFECHDDDRSGTMDGDELRRMFRGAFGFSGDTRPEEINGVVESMVARLFADERVPEDGEFGVRPLCEVARRRVAERHLALAPGGARAPAGAGHPALSVWDIFGGTLVDASAVQHRRLDEVVRDARYRLPRASAPAAERVAR